VIVVRLQGGLGNQMFVYAAARGVADRLDTELVLDTSWMVEGRGWGEIKYELGCFDLDARVCPVWEVGRVPNASRVVRALQHLRPSRRPFLTLVTEDDATNAFLPSFSSVPDNSYLRGYWQFEGYFADIDARIRRDFTFPPLSAEGERLAAEIRTVPAVAVHVRRGDYVGVDRIGFLDVDYYHRATETIANRVGDIQLFVFSDDPEWCAENMTFMHPTTVVERHVSLGRPWQDMQLMSLCRHDVIANSTYSWWGAWLNRSPEKIVVAPRRWVQSDKRAGDPVPEGWIRV
jgi:hypothetical protein